MVTTSTTYSVKAVYSSGNVIDVTSLATVNCPSPLTMSGNTIYANKVMNILGNHSISASYQGISTTATLNVFSDIVENHFYLQVHEYFEDEGYQHEYTWNLNPGENHVCEDSGPTVALFGYTILSNGQKITESSDYITYKCVDTGASGWWTWQEEYSLWYLGEKFCSWILTY